MAESPKVTLPKEVAEAIAHVWDKVLGGLGPKTSIKHSWLTNWRTLSDEFPEQERILIEYFREHPIEYVSALVNGYEVERTPHDELRDYYTELLDEYRNNPSWSKDSAVFLGKLLTVKRTLEILGITVEGINGKEANPCR